MWQAHIAVAAATDRRTWRWKVEWQLPLPHKDFTLTERKLMFLCDVSAELHKKRTRFDAVKKDLLDLIIPELRYGILHPATLCVTYKGKRHLYDNPPDAQRFLQDLKDANA